MTVKQILLNGPLTLLVIDRWDADRVVAWEEDGIRIDEAIEILRRLARLPDNQLIEDAEAHLDALLAARERRFSEGRA